MTQEVLKLALEALELCNGAETVDGVVIYTDKEIAAIKDVLAQKDSEPDWKGLVLAHNEECESRCDKDRCGYARYFKNNGRRCPTCPVYEKIDIDITPPQSKPLTSKEIRAIEVEVAMSNSFAHPTKAEEFVRAIEAAHGIRENT